MSRPRCKNILLPFFVNVWLSLARPASDPEGRFAIVTNVGGGMRWTCRGARRTRSMRTAKPCGPVPPTLGSSLRDDCRGRRWLTSPEHRGEHGAAVNTIARGMPVVPAALSLLACAKCTVLLHARPAGAASIRHSLRPPYPRKAREEA